MGTKGYHSYSGRGSRGKVALVVVLVLILLGACTYLFLQPYVVYEDDGSIRLELPFLEKAQEEAPPEELPVVKEEDIHREEGKPQLPPKAEIKVMGATELPYGILNADPTDLMKGQKAVVVNLKRFDGSFTCRTELKLPDGVLQGNKDTTENLQKILSGKAYTVARVSALCDNAYAAAKPESAIRWEGGSAWVDYYGRSWLDPKSPETKEYLCNLAKECAQLGFDELLLDHFRYPIEGDLQGTTVKEKEDRVKAIHDLTAAIREAAPTLNVSIVLPGSLDTEAAFRLSGLTAKNLEKDFDRIYVPIQSEAYYWLDSTLPESYDRDKKLVLTTSAPTDTGSSLIAQ